MRHRPHPRDERGQVTTALVIVVIVLVSAVAFTGTVLVSRGVDDKTNAQSAADSAALAAVGGSGVRNEIQDLITGLTSVGDLGNIAHGCSDVGRAQAEDYANQNDAQLIDYCFDLFTGQAQTRVRMNHPVSSKVGPATASATAVSGLNFGNCSFQDDPASPSDTPTPTPGPPSGDPSPPPPPPDTGTTLSCGTLKVIFNIDGASGLFSGTPQIELNLEPKLTD